MQVLELDPSDPFDCLVAKVAVCATAPGATAADRAMLDLALAMRADLDRLKPKPPVSLWQQLAGRLARVARRFRRRAS